MRKQEWSGAASHCNAALTGGKEEDYIGKNQTAGQF